MRVWVTVRTSSKVETTVLDLATIGGEPFAAFERQEAGKEIGFRYILLDRKFLRPVAPQVYVYDKEIEDPGPPQGTAAPGRRDPT